MQRFPRYCLLTTAALAMILLAVSVGQRLGNRAAALRARADWDIPELADHLNCAGLQLRLRSSVKHGVIEWSAFLTTTDKDWRDLNGLIKDSSRIHQWRGIVYCEREEASRGVILRLWDDYSLVASPFVFFGDPDLLERIRVILVPFAPPVASQGQDSSS
jgi:hypothetical protein